ncbi:unnamed protein product, partial [Polarella glacialis]
ATSAPSAPSPPRPRPAGLGGLGKFEQLSKTTASTGAGSSRGGSSRGCSSGKSSRSSSRKSGDARDGDISSRCSSGGWDTSTNSSGMSRPHTPPDVAPSPPGSNLLMPDPIRTGLMLPPALFDAEHLSEGKDPVLEDSPAQDEPVVEELQMS